MTYYFAYGSNMSLEQMRWRCPDHRYVGLGVLHGFKWLIYSRGYANITASNGDEVWGSVFQISHQDELSLDKAEGVRYGTYLREQKDVRVGDDTLSCLVYVAPSSEAGVAKAEYVLRINAGIRDATLPEDYVTRYLRPFVSVSDG